jgi:MinD-like ATPase involved in chromosome partitioning or flagellar assembly
MNHLLVGATLPRLLSALDEAVAGGARLTTLTDGAELLTRVDEVARPLDLLILDDTIAPRPGAPLETTLWDIIVTANMRPTPPRTLLLIREESFPLPIREPLLRVAQESGGDGYILPRHGGPAAQAEALAWLSGRLRLAQARSQAWLMPLSGSGGVGKSTQLANIALTLTGRGYRVLIVDADFANGSLSSYFKVPPGAAEPILTLHQECPTPRGAYPLEIVRRRIYHHPCAVDLLLSGRGLVELEDLTMHALRALVASVRQLPYDLVCLDAGPDIKARPYAIDVLRGGGSALIICPPGRKERRGAESVLELLSQLTASDGNVNMVPQAAILFIEAEHGSVADVQAVQRDLTHQYRAATDLGAIPRDARLLSMVAEREQFTTVYEVGARSRYCAALETACDRLIAHMRLAAPADGATHASEARGLQRSRSWLGGLLGGRMQIGGVR